MIQNNEKELFYDNKAAFNETREQPFAELLEILTVRMANVGIDLQRSAKARFCMNRDVQKPALAAVQRQCIWADTVEKLGAYGEPATFAEQLPAEALIHNRCLRRYDSREPCSGIRALF
ncbi:hypothetical protein [uncultured Jannaschia sp.]|uniref:hypothetical protein n=1 Tax=uncultured Jannaschia sp. TaxID=293347 RepID=UPI002601AF8C|nr:hypothetical protein [uncultured Jannaschia sp.]